MSLNYSRSSFNVVGRFLELRLTDKNELSSVAHQYYSETTVHSEMDIEDLLHSSHLARGRTSKDLILSIIIAQTPVRHVDLPGAQVRAH